MLRPYLRESFDIELNRVLTSLVFKVHPHVCNELSDQDINLQHHYGGHRNDRYRRFSVSGKDSDILWR